MNISPLTFNDCQNASQIHQDSFFKAWDAKVFQDFLQTPATFGLKIEKGNTLLGYILWREMLDEAEILTLAVAPLNRRRGLGQMLLTSLSKILKEKAIEKLFLEVAEDNPTAIAFYLHQDFILIGKRPHYYLRENNTSIPALNFYKVLSERSE